MPEIQSGWPEGWMVWGEVQQLKLKYTQPLGINKFIIAVSGYCSFTTYRYQLVQSDR